MQGQQLQRKRRSLHHFAPAALIRALIQPPSPELDGCCQGFFAGWRGLNPAVVFRCRVGFGIAQHEGSRLTLLQFELRDHTPLIRGYKRFGAEQHHGHSAPCLEDDALRQNPKGVLAPREVEGRQAIQAKSH
jgi:hypothetical protein